MTARVLVVDDMPANVKLLEAKLMQEYYEVITASSGQEAIDKAHSESPDIILLDVMMPEMDGFEVCRKLRADPETAHIPVIMVTALSDRADRIDGLEAGADDFLTKPVNDMELFARVKSLVRLKVMIDELRLRGQTGVQFGLDAAGEGVSIRDAKILIIDDDVIQARQLSEKLSVVNRAVKVQGNVENALAECANSDYDLILVSTQMEDVDGLRVCSQLRSNEQTRNVSIIVLVEEEDTHLLLKALELGVNDYIIMPVDVNELVARVKTQVKRKRYQDALRTNYKTSLSLAVTDGLTGLYNRRYMDTHLENMMKECLENSKSLSVMIMDIDHFKLVNDTHGHDVGDEIIKQFADRISANLRPADLAVRYGGEEFVVIMPGTDLENAQIVADRMRERIANVPFEVNTAEGKLTKTCSIGVTSLNRAGGDTPASLLKRSDNALYGAKEGGRDKVILHRNSYPERQVVGGN